jgi:uncharacterized protein YbjT (DUF2867 family)
MESEPRDRVSSVSDKPDPILVTGATGYVGGRLIPVLLEAGYRVRAMGRSLDKLAGRSWACHPRVELAAGDVMDQASLVRAAQGCRTAYYLVHSMLSGKGHFAAADREAAQNMVAAAPAAGLTRMIYLGGLSENLEPASKHLRSRLEVGRILQSGPVPTTHLRTPVILGSGSASFEILRYLVDRLPVMITPRWLRSRNQPIAIRNVLGYLVGCLEQPETIGQTFDIGGPEILTYQDLLHLYAREAGLKRRLIVPVPVLTPKLSAYWIHFVTPVPAAIARPLTEGLTSEAVCTENRIQDLVPQKLLTCREAIRLALDRLAQERVDTCWMDAGTAVAPEWARCGDAEWAGGTILRCGYRVELEATAQQVWAPVQRIGGRTGWYHADFLWRLRGVLDRLAGGVGLRRGRRHSANIAAGDALDFWRVLEVTPNRRLLLSAEMKTPGEALLDIQVAPVRSGKTELRLLSRFLPRGLAGILYWYALYPFHEWVFHGMLVAIARIVGRPITRGPERFTPRITVACNLPPESQAPPSRPPK